MKEIIHEYGGAAIAIIATTAFLISVQVSFFSDTGLMAQLLEIWCKAGC